MSDRWDLSCACAGILFVRGVGLEVQNSAVLHKSVHRSSVLHFSLFVLHFFFVFAFHISFSLLLLCISVLVLYHFEV